MNQVDTVDTVDDVDSVDQVDEKQPNVNDNNTGMYSKLFNSRVVYLYDDKEIDLGSCWISNCSLEHAALAIMVQVERLSRSENIRDNKLLEGYNEIKVVTKHGNFKPKTRTISIKTMASTILELCDVYSDSTFVNALKTNWSWRSSNQGDPYNFFHQEKRKSIKDAQFVLLIKAFRVYLMESVRSFFPKIRDPKRWSTTTATFKQGGSELSSPAFMQFMESLFKLYDDVTVLSPELSEYKSIVSNAIEMGKKEKQEKRDQYHKQRRLEANYNQVVRTDVGESRVGSVSMDELKSGVIAKKTVNTANVPDTTNTSKADQLTVPTESAWTVSDSNLINKVVESGLAPDYEKALKTAEDARETNNDRRDQSDQRNQRRSIKVGRQNDFKKGPRQQRHDNRQNYPNQSDRSTRSDRPDRPDRPDRSDRSDRPRRQTPDERHKSFDRHGDDENWSTVKKKNTKNNQKQKVESGQKQQTK